MILSYMGLDAMTLGNHEFDKPFEILELQSKIAQFPLLLLTMLTIYTADRF